MPQVSSLSAAWRVVPIVRHLTISVDSETPMAFIDITSPIAAAVQALGMRDGTVCVVTRHTTTGLMINEHEPLLLDDLRAMFERLVPSTGLYAHDDPERRVVNRLPGERVNGHAHCRAALLRASESLQVCGGRLTLGRWQRLFLVDFDGGQRRQVALTFLGDSVAPG